MWLRDLTFLTGLGWDWGFGFNSSLVLRVEWLCGRFKV